MAIVKNMLVRIGLDASSLTGGMKKAKEKVTDELSEVSRSAGKLNGIGSAIKGISKDAAAELQSLQGQIRNLYNYSDVINAKLYELFHRPGGENTAQFKSLEQENTRVNNLLDKLEGRMAVVKAQAKTFGNAAADAFAQMGNEAKKAADPKTSRELNRTAKAMKNISSTRWSGLKSIGNFFQDIRRHAQKSSNGVDRLVSSIRRIGFVAAGLRLVSSIFGRLRSIVSAYIAENSALQAQVTQLKASLGQALAPAVNLITNAFSRLMPYIVGVSNAIGELITNLFGSGWTTVADGANAAASATGSAADAQKEYNQQLMGFDQITKVGDKSSSGGGGGSSSTTKPVDGKLPSWMTDIGTRIKEAISSGDWAGAATIITGKLNEMVSNVNWDGFGTKLGGHLDNALSFLSSAVNTFDWYSVGSGLSRSLNGVINRVDWTNLGSTIGGSFSGALNTASAFAEDLDWAGLGNSIADSFTGIWDSIDFAAAGRTLSNGVSGILTTISTTVNGFDWQRVGSEISGKLNSLFSNIDGTKITNSFSGAIGSILGGITGFYAGAIRTAISDIGNAWDEIEDYFAQQIEEFDGNWVWGILVGLNRGAFKVFDKVNQWIKENISDPFIDGFKKAFGIGKTSESDEIQDGGKKIGNKILDGIAYPFKAIKTWVKEHIVNPLVKELENRRGQLAVEVLVNLVNNANDWWNNVKSWWSETTNNGAKAAGEFTVKVKNTASTWWSNTKSWWRSMTNNGTATVGEFTANVRNSAATWWSNVKAWWANRTSNGTAPAGEFTAQLKNTAATWWSNAKSWWNTQSQNGLIVSAGVKLFKDGWQSLSDFIGSVTKTIKIGINWKTEGLNALEAGISKYLFGGKGFPLGLRFAAKGGIVNTAALFGNTMIGEAGREAIVPLERNTEWANIVAGKIADVLGNTPNGGGNNRPMNINLLLDGQVVGRASVNWINGQIASTGVIPLNL